eukprot:TCALIF_08630-PA protein Name:"Similar to SULT1C4 Sulfotransferase 1C4 (Homo sapiens)" AED:0.11 eAED:0.11 QI:74/0.71/0.62/1/0.85/0.75/8/100/616
MALKATFCPLEKDHTEAVLRVFSSGSCELNLVQVRPRLNYLPTTIQSSADKILNLELRPDDVWIITYPKCGTTWTQEIVWQMFNMDFDDNKDLFQKSPFLEMELIATSNPMPPPPPNSEMGPPPEHIIQSIEYCASVPSPRVIKTHLPLSMLPAKLLDTCKVIFVSRHPLDACVSYFHHAKNGKQFFRMHGNFDDYAKLFFAGQVMFGNYWDHLEEAWPKRDHKNARFFWYEDMQADLNQILHELNAFLGRLRTNDELLELSQFVQIKNMKARSMNRAKDEAEKEFNSMFIRQGGCGQWKDYFNGDLHDEARQWLEANMRRTGIVTIPSLKMNSAMAGRELPFEFEPLSKDEIASKRKVFQEGSLELELTKTIPGRVFLPKVYQEDAKRVYNMELRPDDIWIVTYPKCGTTWMQETVWQIVNYELDTTEDLFSRVPFLEAGHIIRSGPKPSPPPTTEGVEPATPPAMPDFFLNPIDYLEKKTTRRIIKTHLPFELLPPNILDGGWKLKDNKNFQFVWYEDLKKDHAKGVRELSEFLGIKRTEDEIRTLVKHLSIDEMRKRAMQEAKDSEEKVEFSKFFRKGVVGDWKNYFAGEKLEEWENWIKENVQGTDIQMNFE